MLQSNNFKKNQKWIAIGLLFTIIILIVGIFIYPLISLGLDYREIRRDHIFNYVRYKKTLLKKETLTKNFEIINKKYTEQHYFYTNKTTALAAADLQSFITSTITEAGGQIIRKSSASKVSEGNFNRIIIDVNMMVTMTALRSILYKIETTTPLIIINHIQIKTTPKKRNIRTRKLESSNQLMVNFKASSFVGT